MTPTASIHVDAAAADRPEGLRVAVASPSRLFAETVAVAAHTVDAAATVRSGDDLVALADPAATDLLVLHRRALDGSRTPGDLLATLGETPPTVVFGPAVNGEVVDALRAGARGWIDPADTGIEDLARYLDRARAGEPVLDPHTATQAAATSLPSSPATSPKNEPTDRQLEVLALVANGQTDQEIARTLTMAPSTAKRHVEDVRKKLDAVNRSHAVAIALSEGHLRPDDVMLRCPQDGSSP